MLGDFFQSFSGGFWPTAPPVGEGARPNTVIDGRNCLYMPDGSLRVAKGVGSTVAANQGALRMYVVNNMLGYADFGSVIGYQQAGYFYVGDNIRVGSFLSVVSTAQRIGFQLNGQQFLAGLMPGPMPGLALAPMVTGKITGIVSVQLTRRRTLTQGEGNPGPPSPAVTGAQSKVRVTIPGADIGQDAWGLYATFAGFGLQGPYFFLRELKVGVDVPMGGGTVDVDWFNNELGSRRPPTNHFQPYQCLYVASLANVVIGMGGLGGVAIQPSIPGDPESYPISVLFTTPPETIEGINPRPAENELIFWTLNSIQSLVATGDDEIPILIRGRWPVAGVQSRHGLCFAESDIYCFSGEGCTRIPDGGGPETEFATPVQAFIKGLNLNPADIVVGYDQRYQHVVYFLGPSLLALVYNRQSGQWSPPLSLRGWASSCATVNGTLFFSMVADGGHNVYSWESGSGGTYYAQSNWASEPRTTNRKTHWGVRAVIDSPAGPTALKVYRDFQTDPFLDATLSAGALKNTDWNTSKAGAIYRQISTRVSGTGNGNQIIGVEYMYNTHTGNRF